MFHAKAGKSEAVVDAGHPWLVTFFTELRAEFQKELSMEPGPSNYVFPPDSEFTQIPRDLRKFAGPIPALADFEALMLTSTPASISAPTGLRLLFVQSEQPKDNNFMMPALF